MRTAAAPQRRQREKVCVESVSSEAHISTNEFTIFELNVKVEESSVPGHAKVIGAWRQAKERVCSLRLHFAVNLNGSAGRSGGDAQRGSNLVQLQEDVAVLRNIENARISPVARELNVQHMPARRNRQ